MLIKFNVEYDNYKKKTLELDDVNIKYDIKMKDDINLNTNEKLNILKDNISTIIDKKLDEYETNIIKKAY